MVYNFNNKPLYFLSHFKKNYMPLYDITNKTISPYVAVCGTILSITFAGFFKNHIRKFMKSVSALYIFIWKHLDMCFSKKVVSYSLTLKLELLKLCTIMCQYTY